MTAAVVRVITIRFGDLSTPASESTGSATRFVAFRTVSSLAKQLDCLAIGRTSCHRDCASTTPMDAMPTTQYSASINGNGAAKATNTQSTKNEQITMTVHHTAGCRPGLRW